MAYFQRHQDDRSEEAYRPPMGDARSDTAYYDAYGDGSENGGEDSEAYDDGFDELLEDEYADLPEEEALSEEELEAERRRKFRIAAGAGDLTAVLVGVAVILLLTALLINMISFVKADLFKSFSVWMTNF